VGARGNREKRKTQRKAKNQRNQDLERLWRRDRGKLEGSRKFKKIPCDYWRISDGL